MAVSHPLHLDPFFEYLFTWSYFYFPFTPTDLWLLGYFTPFWKDIYLVVFWLVSILFCSLTCFCIFHLLFYSLTCFVLNVFFCTVPLACALYENKLHCHRGTFQEARCLCQDLSPQISTNLVKIPWPYNGYKLNLLKSTHVHCTGTSCTATVGPGGKRDIYVRILHLKFQPIPLRFHGLIWPLRMPIPERACSLHGNQLHCHRGTWWEKRYLCQDPSPQISASSVQIPWPYLAFALT